MSKVKHILIVFFVGISFLSAAQEFQKKSPEKAAFYSAILPGSGQFYTKTYWKVPIIYGGLITSAYYIKKSQESYQLYKTALLNRIEGNNDEFIGIHSDNALIILTNHHRKNKEVSTLMFFLTYVLNIVDASVNAHLFDYDISEDLSLKIHPIYLSENHTTGISLSFNL